MSFFLELVISGLAIGTLYGLIGMAYACIYKATGVVNFAQGEVMMLITYTTCSVMTLGQWPFGVALVLSPLIGVVCGLLIERLVIRPMIGQPPFAIVMVTIGLAVILRSLIVLIWGSEPRRFAVPESNAVWQLAGVGLYPVQWLSFGIFLAAVVLVWTFLRYSRLGIALRATAVNERVAMLMGVDVRRISAFSWAAAAALSGLAGTLFALATFVGSDLFVLGLKAFPATILGGLDAVTGSGAGGLAIGVAENLVGGYIDTTLKEIAGFLVIIVVLMLRPHGFFGDRGVDRV